MCGVVSWVQVTYIRDRHDFWEINPNTFKVVLHLFKWNRIISKTTKAVHDKIIFISSLAVKIFLSGGFFIWTKRAYWHNWKSSIAVIPVWYHILIKKRLIREYYPGLHQYRVFRSLQFSAIFTLGKQKGTGQDRAANPVYSNGFVIHRFLFEIRLYLMKVTSQGVFELISPNITSLG